jgi:hypothetical protein
MKKLSVVFVTLCVSLSGPAAFARGGSGGSHHSSSGGAAGTSVGAPGTNAVVDREDAKVEKMIESICRGC